MIISILIIPLLGGIILLLSSKRPRWHFTVNFLVSSASLIAAVIVLTQTVSGRILTLQIGNWPAPFGITLVADLLSSVMVLLTAIIGWAVAIYANKYVNAHQAGEGFFALMQLMLFGIYGAFLTGDMFNLYVWFEVLLIASFSLMTLGSTSRQTEGAFKYVLLNLVASAFFLVGIGLLYGVAGTLNMADLARKAAMMENTIVLQTVALIFMVSFGIKAAVFPLYFWLPASYHTAPIPVAAIFAGLLTKVGVYALIRVFSLIFIHDTNFTHTILLIVAGLTMLSGVIGAAAQNDFRRILSFHIISQIGYMIMGLALFTPLAVAGAVFYIIHHIIVKSNLFLIAGIVERIHGSFDVSRLGDVYKKWPLLALLFFIPAFSLAGIPPLSGFWAKLTVIKAGLDIRQFAIVFVALGVGLLTIFSMTKIWAQVFWKEQPITKEHRNTGNNPVWMELIPVAFLALLTIIIGLLAGPVFEISNRAAEQLLNHKPYIEAVLGGGR
ncbi:MAG: Na+/H+ antiporter subunit D [Caldithrix sp.]|nr:Na+/H+ antiporter subunit D [Caldithrix sp.]